MKKIITTILLGMFLISIVSAGINLELEDLGEIYAGETTQKNLTITTTKDMLVYLSHNSSINVQLNYSSPIQVNKEKIILVNISTNKYMDSSGQIIIIYANAEGEEQTQTNSPSGGSSSSSTYIKKIIDNVSGREYGDASRYPRYYVNEVEEDIPVENPIIIEEDAQKRNYEYIWLIGITLLLIVIIIKLILNKVSKKG